MPSGSHSQRKRFEQELELGDRFWTTYRHWGPPIIFVYTEQQAAEVRDSALPAQWAHTWHQLVLPHDEFGYLNPENITFTIDSKENFDTNYEGNWYYYFK